MVYSAFYLVIFRSSSTGTALTTWPGLRLAITLLKFCSPLHHSATSRQLHSCSTCPMQVAARSHTLQVLLVCRFVSPVIALVERDVREILKQMTPLLQPSDVHSNLIDYIRDWKSMLMFETADVTHIGGVANSEQNPGPNWLCVLRRAGPTRCQVTHDLCPTYVCLQSRSIHEVSFILCCVRQVCMCMCVHVHVHVSVCVCVRA